MPARREYPNRKRSPNARSAKKSDDKAKLLAYATEGMSAAEACRLLGRPITTYERWRQEDPPWASRVSAVLLRNRQARKGIAHGEAGIEFVEFRRVFFGHDTAPHHYRMIEAIERAEPDTITMILAFPEAAKTALMTDRVCYRLGAVDPNLRHCVISEGQDLARKIVGHVATRMTDEMQYLPYITAYGPFRSPERGTTTRPWNADYLQVLGASNDEKEPSLEARGWGSKLYGGRYDEMILDDMQSSESLNQTPQMLRYIRQTVLTRPAKGVGKTIYVGSRVGPNDLPETLIEEGMIDTLVTIPALERWLPRDEHFYVTKDNKVHLAPDCPEISTWADYWSMHQLAVRRKKVGEEIWARTYMQQRVVSEGASFTEEMIQKVKDPDRGLGLPKAGGLGTAKIMSIDPAFDSGVCAFAAAAYSANRLWLIDMLGRTDIHRYEDIYDQVATWAMRYRPDVVVLEQNAFQKGLHQDDRMIALSAKFGFEIVAHQTSRNKNDPVIGVKMMASAFIDDELSVPWGDDAAVGAMGPLLDELRNWRPKIKQLKQDRVMALWFIWLYWEQARQQMNLILPDQFAPSWARGAGAMVPSWARSA